MVYEVEVLPITAAVTPYRPIGNDCHLNLPVEICIVHSPIKLIYFLQATTD